MQSFQGKDSTNTYMHAIVTTPLQIKIYTHCMPNISDIGNGIITLLASACTMDINSCVKSSVSAFISRKSWPLL